MIGNATMTYALVSPLSFIGATNYDCAAYGAGNYNDSSLCTTQSPNTGVAPTTNSSTEFPAWSIVGIVLGLVLVVCGIVVLLKKRRHKSL